MSSGELQSVDQTSALSQPGGMTLTARGWSSLGLASVVVSVSAGASRGDCLFPAPHRAARLVAAGFVKSVVRTDISGLQGRWVGWYCPFS